MSGIMRWWGMRIGIALLLGAVVAALTGSMVFGAVAAGLVVLVVINIAAYAYASREIASRGGIPLTRPGRRAAGGVAHTGAPVVGPGTGDGCGGGFDGGGGFGGGDGGGGGGC